ncbi:cyclic nucleotide-binding domain-containing protein [Thermodesulfobacteriota bacterium]
MDTKEAARNSFIFTGLQDDELDAVLNITREKRFCEGDAIMQEGDGGDTMYMVVEGEVGISKTLTMKFGDDDFRKTEKVLTRFRPEDNVVIGEMALICQDSRSASVLANTDCVLLEISREDFVRLVESRPELGVKILLKLSELLVGRIRHANEDVIRLTTALSIALSK